MVSGISELLVGYAGGTCQDSRIWFDLVNSFRLTTRSYEKFELRLKPLVLGLPLSGRLNAKVRGGFGPLFGPPPPLVPFQFNTRSLS